MKLGVFGDSFADIRTYDNGWEYNFAWPKLLTQMLGCEADYYGQAGTSIFWSYENFVKNYQKYTHVVFTYTYPWRWPYLDPELLHLHFMYSKPQLIKNQNLNKDKQEIFYMMDKVSPYIINDHLLQFIAKNVVRNVNDICKQNNIKLVNLFVPDNEYHLYNSNDLLFSTIEDINWVSREVEKITIANKQYDMTSLCNSGNRDYRWCHLLEPNNRILAKYLFDLFDRNEHIHAKTINDWSVSDPKMDLLYNQ